MHLAILVTNTDDSDFAKAHPDDGEVFARLVHIARPGWTVEVFSVKDGAFPADMSEFDGAMITGSPASVRSDAEWVAQLFDLIRQMDQDKQPVFGACFGHQAVAAALGGAVDWNPGGWVHGLTRNRVVARPEWGAELPDVLHLYGCHSEQVTALPPGARNLTSSDACPSSGFSIGRHIYTTQQHPEMDRVFFEALIDEMATTLGPDLCRRSRDSLREPADQAAYAESIARFFEQARRP